MAGERIEVKGLKELNRALKQLDTELPKALKGKWKDIAERVATVTRAKLPTLTGNMVRRTKAVGTTKGAAIRWSGIPYAGAVEFGGWPKGREYIQKGRYLWPTIDAERSRIEEEVEHVLDDFLARARLD